MTGSPLACAASISDLMYSSATQASSPHEVRQRLIDTRIGSGRSPQNAQLTSIMSRAGLLPKPARAPNPPAANTALSRSVRNLSQIRSVIDVVLVRVGYPRPYRHRSATLRQRGGLPQLPGTADLRTVGLGRRVGFLFVEEHDLSLAQAQRFAFEPGVDLGVDRAENRLPD